MLNLALCLPSGESGLGKSTLINSLFLTDLYSSEYPGPSHRIKKTVQVMFIFLLIALWNLNGVAPYYFTITIQQFLLVLQPLSQNLLIPREKYIYYLFSNGMIQLFHDTDTANWSIFRNRMSIWYLLFSSAMPRAAVAEAIVCLYTARFAKLGRAFGLRYRIGRAIGVVFCFFFSPRSILKFWPISDQY